MFKIVKKSKKSKARIGRLKTEHGFVETPVFMPPATKGYLKSLDIKDVSNAKTQMLLVNTYHLYLKPGDSYIKNFGGIHKFMGWDKPILSDSGGFQVWSLNKRDKKLVKINDQGVEFTSILDGSKHIFTPEKSVKIQHNLGVDILMAFDQCASDDLNLKEAECVLDKTNRWLLRNISEHKKLNTRFKSNKLLFGIAQGGKYINLRKKAIEFMQDLEIDGLALGGETIGYNMKETKKLLDNIYDIFPKEKPIYTMGLGSTPQDMIDAIIRGVDMMDCVNPARLARHGSLFVGNLDFRTFKIKSNEKDNILRIGQSKYKNDKKPIDKNCNCFTCQNYSRAYLRYLYLINEPLYLRLATIHNLHFTNMLINTLKDFIKNE